jgi:hypothetical protein
MKHQSSARLALATRTTLTLEELEELSDDPGRNEPGAVEVRAILTFDDETGFALSVQDGPVVYDVIDNHGRQVRFRTAELALQCLLDVSGLDPVVCLVRARQGRRGH